MTVHIGILGAGNISETHARAAREIDGVEIVAVCGTNRDKAARLAQTYGGAAYSDVDEFLNHRPLEVVLIGSPSAIHAEQGVLAARRGLHVLTEKPIDVTTERADMLITECERAGVKLGVFFQDRTRTHLRKTKEMLASNRLGKPILVSASVKWYRPPEYYSESRWRGKRALDGGGALMNQGVHTVDLLLWLLGDVVRVSAVALTALHDIEVEDTVVATLEFANGAIGTLEATTAAYPGYNRRIELTGSEGTIVIEQDLVVAADLRTPADDFEHVEEDRNQSANSPVVSDLRGHRMIIEDFLRAIETNSTPYCDGREGRRSVELVQAIYHSAASKEPVTLPAR